MIEVSCDNFSKWRLLARQLLAQKITPCNVYWQTNDQSTLFDGGGLPPTTGSQDQYRVPKAFIDKAQTVANLRKHEKWAYLYKVLWRLIFEDKQLLSHKNDSDIRWLDSAVRAIHRDCHKMKAFVRFAKVVENQEGDYYAAWFEPRHLIVEQMAPFFRKRFTGMNWSILTPDLCCHWDRQALSFSPGIAKPEHIHDELTKLWKTYYANIFNPARVKVKAMQKEMPKLYWKNLPEAELIRTLLSTSSGNIQSMLDAPLQNPDALRDKSKYLKQQQDVLRKRSQSSDKTHRE